MPAAAVIPAPTVYAKVVAVEKLVVGLGERGRSVAGRVTGAFCLDFGSPSVLLTECRRWPISLL